MEVVKRIVCPDSFDILGADGRPGEICRRRVFQRAVGLRLKEKWDEVVKCGIKN